MSPMFLLCLACLTPAGAPKVKGMRVEVHATAPAVWVVYTVTLAGAPDSARVTVTGPTSTTRKLTATKTDSVSFPHPAEGGTISGTVTATPFRGGIAYPAASAAWTYTEPTIPRAVVQVRVTPISFTRKTGQPLQVCAAAQWSTGEWTRVVPWPAVCEPLYPALIAS